MLVDALKRPIKDLRISVTDRCNFRCSYCMPLDEYEWIHKKEILTFEEISTIGYPICQTRCREDSPNRWRTARQAESRQPRRQAFLRLMGLQTYVSLPTARCLPKKLQHLRQPGLKRVNISVDSLDPEKFRQMTKRGDLSKVLEGIFAAKQHGLDPIKLNAVIEKGLNEDDILSLVEFSRDNGFALRFIEYMDVGNSNDWTSGKLVSKKEIIEKINAQYPLKEVGRAGGSAPSVDYEFIDGRGDIGVIASVTEPFCSSCTRVRLTADGKIVTCLFSGDRSRRQRIVTWRCIGRGD